MVKKTIAGKTYAEVFQELLDPLPASKVKDRDGYPYFGYEVYKERLDNAVGITNYDFCCTNTSHVVINEKQHLICREGTLTIYNDDREVVKKITMSGGNAVVVAKASGNAINYNNDLYKVDTQCFKNCMKFLGVGTQQLKELKNGSNPVYSESYREPAPSAPSAPSMPNTASGKVKIKLTKRFSSISKGIKSTGVVNGKEMEVIAWQRGIDTIEACMPLGKFIEQAQPGVKIIVQGISQFYNQKEQFIINEFYLGGN